MPRAIFGSTRQEALFSALLERGCFTLGLYCFVRHCNFHTNCGLAWPRSRSAYVANSPLHAYGGCPQEQSKGRNSGKDTYKLTSTVMLWLEVCVRVWLAVQGGQMLLCKRGWRCAYSTVAGHVCREGLIVLVLGFTQCTGGVSLRGLACLHSVFVALRYTLTCAPLGLPR